MRAALNSAGVTGCSALLPQLVFVYVATAASSTSDSWRQAGIAVAKSVRLALSGELVPDAVNVSSGYIAEEVRPGIPLVEKLGRIFTAVAGAVPAQLDVDVRGEITEHDVSVWKLVALKGLFTDVVEDPVTYVNAPILAEQRDCQVRLLTEPDAGDFRNITTLRGTLADGTIVSVSGTLTGPKMVEKIVDRLDRSAIDRH